MKKNFIFSLSLFLSLFSSSFALAGEYDLVPYTGATDPRYEKMLKVRALKQKVLDQDGLLDHISSYLDGTSLQALEGASQSCRQSGYRVDDDRWSRYRKRVMDRFRAQFVQIPAGTLPDRTQIEAMQADRYPVTRELWNVVMGGMPEHVPADQRITWNQSPRTPVTYVNWENEDGSRAEVQEFLKRLNDREAHSRCTYDLPTDRQLWYLIRGDVTGNNQDRYSAGVTDENVDQYVTHSGNSNGQIQPVGNKQLNVFGIELGNVWKLSKVLCDPAHPGWGRSIRGGSWDIDVEEAGAAVRVNAFAGGRFDYMGFSLVRRCGQ